MIEIFTWAQAHLTEIVEGYLALVGFASWVVN